MRELSLAELKHELSTLSGEGTSNLELVHLLDDMISNVKSVDDLYFFFDKTLAELKTQLTKLKGAGIPSGTNEDYLRNEGSLTDLFLRRCILSFNQMMFEELQKLYEGFLMYREGQTYKVK